MSASPAALVEKALKRLATVRAELHTHEQAMRTRLQSLDAAIDQLRGAKFDTVALADLTEKPRPKAAEKRETRTAEAPRADTLAGKIVAHVAANPGATARTIAAALGHPLASVRASISPLVPGRLARHAEPNGAESRYTLPGIDMPGTDQAIPPAPKAPPAKPCGPPSELTGALKLVERDVMARLRVAPATLDELQRRTEWPMHSLKLVADHLKAKGAIEGAANLRIVGGAP